MGLFEESGDVEAAGEDDAEAVELPRALRGAPVAALPGEQRDTPEARGVVAQDGRAARGERAAGDGAAPQGDGEEG